MTTKQRRDQWEYLSSLGFKGFPFKAKWTGGKCGISGLKIHKGEMVVYFRDFGLCYETSITQWLYDNDPSDGQRRQQEQLTAMKTQLTEIKQR